MVEVVKLRQAEPNADAVELLEKLLEAAKSGHLRDIAFAGNLSDGGIRSGHSPSRDMVRMLAAVHRLAHSINLSLDEGTEDIK